MLEILFKLGIPTYTTTIYTAIPISPTQEIPIAKQLPMQIGRIYGLSLYTDGVTPAADTLITSAEAAAMYMSLKEGNAYFLEELRLSDMQTIFTGGVSTRPDNYLPVNIGNGVDLSTSKYINPTAIVSPASPAKAKTIALKLWYVDVPTYKYMVEKGIVFTNAK